MDLGGLFGVAASFLKKFWPCAWEILGQVQHLFGRTARQSQDGEVNGVGWGIREKREDRAPETKLGFAGKRVRNC